MSDLPDYGDWGHPLWGVLGDPLGTPYVPFDWQRDHIHRRFHIPRLIGCCGRRAGKTLAMRAEAVREALPPGKILKPPLVYLVAPNYELTMKLFEPLWNAFVNEDGPLHFLHSGHDKQRKIIDLVNGARLQAKSADDPKAIQGDRVTCAIPDEAQDIMDEAWANLLPGLTDSKGKLRAIGVARGKTRFRSFFQRGLDKDEQGDQRFYSFSVSSYENKEIDHAEIDAMRDEHTENEFRSLYLAEWGDDDGTVFKNAHAVFTGEEREPAGNPTIMGLDIAKQHDYTWAMIGDVKQQAVIAGDRFTGIDYTIQVPRIARMYHEYKCRFIHMDANGPGQAPADYLRAEGCAIVPFSWGNSVANKAALIGTLAREIERETFTIPSGPDSQWDVLLRELNFFEGTVIPSGIRYSAPPGYYDDGVISLALLVDKMVKNKGMSKSPVRKPTVSFGPSSNTKRSRMPALPRPKSKLAV